MNPLLKRTLAQEFGDQLRLHRERRSLTQRRAADMVGANVSDLDAFELGTKLPTSKQWEKYKHIVHRQLAVQQPLYTELRKRGDTVDNVDRLKQSLGAKLAPAVVTQAAPVQLSAAPPASEAPSPRPGTAAAQLGQPIRGFAADGRALSPQRPPNAQSVGAVNERKIFARGVLQQRPMIRTSGNDSLVEMLRRRFGVGLSPHTIEEMRAELVRETMEAEIRRDISLEQKSASCVTAPAPVEHPVAKSAKSSPPISSMDPDALSAAVQLVLEAVPGLAELTIAVDANGEASVTYHVREVRTVETQGTLQVKR